MTERRSGDRLYTAILVAFLVALVGLGVLGVPALLVAAIGLATAAVGIAIFHRRLEGRTGRQGSLTSKRSPIPGSYAPSVLEGSSMRRRRGLHLRRRHHPNPPLRFR